MRRRVRAPNCAFWVAGGREYGARSFHESVGLDPIHPSRNISHVSRNHHALPIPPPTSQSQRSQGGRSLSAGGNWPSVWESHMYIISQALPLATKKGKPPCLSMVAGGDCRHDERRERRPNEQKAPTPEWSWAEKWPLGLARVEEGRCQKASKEESCGDKRGFHYAWFKCVSGSPYDMPRAFFSKNLTGGYSFAGP